LGIVMATVKAAATVTITLTGSGVCAGVVKTQYSPATPQARNVQGFVLELGGANNRHNENTNTASP
jgi:hypothetical protein